MSEVALANQFTPIDLLTAYANYDRNMMEYDYRVLALAEDVARRYLNNPSLPEKIRDKHNDLTLIALKAFTLGVSASSAFEKCYVVNGKVAYETDFIRQLIDRAKRWYGHDYETDIDPDEPEVETFNEKGILDKKVKNKRCRAFAYDKEQVDHQGNPVKVYGPWVSVAMAVGEKWWSKSGSKWPTMTDYMLRKRAYAYWAKEHAQTYLNGMVSVDVYDDQEAQVVPTPIDAAADLKAKGVKFGQTTRPVAKPEPAKPVSVDAEEATVVEPATEVVDATTGEVVGEPEVAAFPQPADGATWEDYSLAELYDIHKQMRENSVFTDAMRNNMANHLEGLKTSATSEEDLLASVIKSIRGIETRYQKLSNPNG